MLYPKIELHVHLEGTVQPATLLEIARRNDVAQPVRDVDELAALYQYRDFAHFVSVWVLTTQALRRTDDFRRIVVEYANEASAYGAVYIEAIFSPRSRCGGAAHGRRYSRVTATVQRKPVSSTG